MRLALLVVTDSAWVESIALGSLGHGASYHFHLLASTSILMRDLSTLIDQWLKCRHGLTMVRYDGGRSSHLTYHDCVFAD